MCGPAVDFQVRAASSPLPSSLPSFFADNKLMLLQSQRVISRSSTNDSPFDDGSRSQEGAHVSLLFYL